MWTHMRNKTRKERAHDRMRSKILGAAIELFGKGGPEAVTMRDIGARIEYSAGSIYRYFQGKDAIVRELCNQGFDILFELMQERTGSGDPAQRLYGAGLAYLDFAQDHPDYFDLVFTQPELSWDPDPETPSKPRKAFLLLNDIVREGMEQGILAPGDAVAASYGYWALVHGMAMLLVKEQMRAVKLSERRAMAERALAYHLPQGAAE